MFAICLGRKEFFEQAEISASHDRERNFQWAVAIQCITQYVKSAISAGQCATENFTTLEGIKRSRPKPVRGGRNQSYQSRDASFRKLADLRALFLIARP